MDLTHSCRAEYYYSAIFKNLLKKKYWSYWLQVCTIRLSHVCSFSAGVQLPSSCWCVGWALVGERLRNKLF